MQAMGTAHAVHTWHSVAVAGVVATLAAGCASGPRAPMVQVDGGSPSPAIPGLDVCDRPSSASVLHVDGGRPLTVFVHGRGDSGARFRELAHVFAEAGQQTVCFNYDGRESIEQSSGELVSAIEALEERLPPSRITVLAHSIGGLVARRALIEERAAPLRSRAGFTFQLLTVATPFAGIESTSDCGKTWLHFLSLGVTAVVCSAIVGNSWAELPPSSSFMKRPGTLIPAVERVLEVVTDERGSCRPGIDGPCRPDFVFALTEQQNARVESDPRLRSVKVRAGHVAIVGGDGNVPEKLVSVLEKRGFLPQAPLAQRPPMQVVAGSTGGAAEAR